MARTVACALAALLCASPSWGQGSARVSKVHGALETSDGVRATLYRYPPAIRSARAILLLPDVGMTHRAFDFEGRGLAPHLQGAGWEVFVVEYRGAGRSEVPFGGYALEDLLEGDVEAAFARAHQGHERIAVGGVGLGASLALALAGRHPDRVSQLVALQPLAAPDAIGAPAMRALAQLERGEPWIDLRRLTAKRMDSGRSWFDVLLANDGSLRSDHRASTRTHVLAAVPKAAVRQIEEALRTRKLAVGGESVEEWARRWKGRTFLAIAPRDNWIHPEFALPLRDMLGKERVRVHVLGPFAGASRDFGHLGMLLGREAAEDLFLPVARFLEEGSP